MTRDELLKTLGPGLITGASDDDPSGIATYSQVGAQFGYGMLWTMPFSFPLMAGIQLIAAEIGRVSGHGIAGNMARHYPRWLLYGTVALMLVANVINLGADIGAMGAATAMLVGGPPLIYAAVLAVGSVALQVTVPYHRYVRVLKWLTLSLFAYVLTVFIVAVPWGQALRSTVIPSIAWDAKSVTALVAVLGTTVSPYLFFWQASEEVEDTRVDHGERALKRAPEQAPYQLGRIVRDTLVGMGFSNLVAWCIILSVAATLHAHGVTKIQTSTQAAEALRPIAGPLAYLMFTLGILGTGLLALPVLAGSAAYGVGEALHWRVGLEKPAARAKGFYGVMVVATLLGLGLAATRIDPIQALFWSAVINGVAAGPIMVTMLLMARNRRVMGDLVISPGLAAVGWVATAVMLLSAVAMFSFWGA